MRPQAHFFHINGPEIIHKFYGESEANLRKIFDEAHGKRAEHHLPRRDRRHRAPSANGASATWKSAWSRNCWR